MWRNLVLALAWFSPEIVDPTDDNWRCAPGDIEKFLEIEYSDRKSDYAIRVAYVTREILSRRLKIVNDHTV